MCNCIFATKGDFPRIVGTFDEAFADYFLKMSISSERWLFNRCVKNGVEFDHCVAAVDGDRMVGITLIGFDNWLGERAAFDAGTGIIPDYRGQGLARKMFDHSLPKLSERGVKKFLLEVLQQNEPAIKAYQKTGFKITREFDCLELILGDREPTGARQSEFEFRPVAKEQITDFTDQLDWQPSWENSFSSIQRIPDETSSWGAFAGDYCVGILVYYPLLNWILSFVVQKDFRRRGVASELMSHFVQTLPSGHESVKITNVDCSDAGMLTCLQNLGFTSFALQYEMELAL